MQAVFQKYINYLEAERNASPHTVKNYKADLVEFFRFLNSQGCTSLKQADKDSLRNYLFELTQQGKAKTSIARKLSSIRSFYRYLMREEILTASPIPLTQKKWERSSFSIKLDKHLPTFLNREEIERLLAVPDLSRPQGQRDRAILELFYASGLRVSELVKLNIDDINFDTNEIRVLGKGSKKRVVLMGRPAAGALSDYINNARPGLTGQRATNAVFLSGGSRRITTRGVQKLLDRYARSLGIDKKVHPHMLRHTFATHLLDGGADLRVVQELLGHADLSSTQIYTHVTKAHARKGYLAAHPMAQGKDNDANSQPPAKAAP